MFKYTTIVLHLLCRHLIKEVKEDLPEGTPIPSITSVAWAFLPPRKHTKTARLFSGKLEIKHTIQRRQLRTNDVDLHYNNALRQYAKEFAVERDAIFISYDDKAKVGFF